jgi:hypothetical protein
MLLMAVGGSLLCWAAIWIAFGFEWVAAWLAGTGLLFVGLAMVLTPKEGEG